MPRTETSKHKVILLVRLPEQRFMEEYRKLVLRRWKQTGEGVTFRPIVDADGDGVVDPDDNCVDVSNPDQDDADQDGTRRSAFLDPIRSGLDVRVHHLSRALSALTRAAA